MFDSLQTLPPDPLLGIIEMFRNDQRETKIDLGVGVYKDEQGRTPVMAAVKQAEAYLLESQQTKAYLGPQGNQEFTEQLGILTLGQERFIRTQSHLSLLQTPGGCGALRVAAELIQQAQPASKIWTSDPTWANHVPLLGNAGLQIKRYPYYDYANRRLQFDLMREKLQQADAGDLVLLHACCHNPSGADLSQAQWRDLIELMQEKSLIPFIDLAYQGFGRSLDEDVYGLQLAVDQLPEVVFAISCSKNFGLYRDRTGLVGIKHTHAAEAKAAMSNLVSIVRGIYSMPPDHGAACVAKILADAELNALWRSEVDTMRDRICGMRLSIAEGMRQRGFANNFDYLSNEHGMFSFLGISPTQVGRLATNSGIYMAESSRISIAGLNQTNINYFCDALAAEL